MDQSIISEFVSGNHEAYRRIFNVYYPKVKHFVWAFLKNEDDANEVTQLVVFNR